MCVCVCISVCLYLCNLVMQICWHWHLPLACISRQYVCIFVEHQEKGHSHIEGAKGTCDFCYGQLITRAFVSVQLSNYVCVCAFLGGFAVVGTAALYLFQTTLCHKVTRALRLARSCKPAQLQVILAPQYEASLLLLFGEGQAVDGTAMTAPRWFARCCTMNP